MYNDADIEQWEMDQVGRAVAAAHRAGRCTHGSAVGYSVKRYYPEQEGLRPGQSRCRSGCKAVFDSDEAWHAAMNEAIGY